MGVYYLGDLAATQLKREILEKTKGVKGVERISEIFKLKGYVFVTELCERK